MKYPYILITVFLLSQLALAVAPVSAYMATTVDSGVSRGEYDNQMILEAKDTFTKSEEGMYVVPWVGIVPGSEMNPECNMTVDFRYRLITPEGMNYDMDVDDPEGNYLYRTKDKIPLSSNRYYFNESRATTWFRISSLIKKAEVNRFTWPGIWTLEYYFGNFDCNYNGEYEKTKVLTFTLVDDSPQVATRQAPTDYPEAVRTQQSAVPVTHLADLQTQSPDTLPAPTTQQSGPGTIIVIGTTALALFCLSGRKH